MSVLGKSPLLQPHSRPCAAHAAFTNASGSGRRTLKPRCALAVDKQAAAKAITLPESLRNNVAVLHAPNPTAPGGITNVYLLGMSHVSQVSCDHIRELVHLVKPDVVMVEVCKDRLALMVDAEKKAKDLWVCRKIEMEGLPATAGWPAATELKQLLAARIGRPFTTQEIEDDVRALLATGLFKSVQPKAEPGSWKDAPAFTVLQQDGRLDMQVVAPLARVRFLVTPRALPAITEMSARLDSSLKGSSVSQEQLEQVCAQAVAASQAEGGSAVDAYMGARAALVALFDCPVAVAFSGIEGGRAEVLVKAVKPGDKPFVSGLEGSAAGGEGYGIEAFKPSRGSIPLSGKMRLPVEALDRFKSQVVQQVQQAAAQATAALHFTGRSSFRVWRDEEVAAQQQLELAPSPVADAFGALMTGTYSRLQGRAAETVGLEPGAAWRVAMEAATEVGAQQVMLGDLPSEITERKLAESMFAASGGRLAGALGALVAALVAASTDVAPQVPDGAVAGAAVAAAAALLWPIVGPFLEVYRFSGMSAEEIEDAVAMKEPITAGDLSQPTRLFGEDALLSWPGAMGPIIRDRDAYMAKAIAAAATQQPGVAPSFVLGEVEGKLTWRYMVPESGPQGSAPAGSGDGALSPLEGVSAVVGVVGTAHVHGMVRDWEQHVRDQDVGELLKVELKQQQAAAEGGIKAGGNDLMGW